jgi:TPR repeat protein
MTHKFRLNDGILRIPPWDYSTMRIAAQRGGLTPAQRADIRRWAKAGHADSQYLLARGDRLKSSRDRWLRAAALQDHPEACFDLHCATGDNNWLTRAADAGWPPAQHKLATMLAVGYPIAEDLERSRALYLAAASHNHQASWFHAGSMLLLGLGGPAEPDQAVEWLAKATTSKDSIAAVAAQLLSELYDRGLHGVAKDPVRAEFWKQNFRAWQDAFQAEELSEHLLQHGFEGFPDDLPADVLGHVLVNHFTNSADINTVRELLRRGANPNFALPPDDGFPGSTALSWSTGNFEILKLLVEHGARVPFECGQGTIVSVHEVCESGRLDILRYLVQEAEGKAALSRYDDFYRTPLIVAAAAGHLDIVDYLIRLGTDVEEHIDETALEVAMRNGHIAVAERLLAATSG